MTKWEIVVLCFGMLLLILATTAHAADTRSASPCFAMAVRQMGNGDIAVRD